MRISIALPLILATVVACGSSPQSTPQPTASTPPASVATPGDPVKQALVRDNIDVLYCGSEPQSDWCDYLFLVGGQPDVLVDGTSLFVAVAGETPVAIAEQLCRDLVIGSFDDNAEPIGHRHVHVQSGPDTILADCDLP